MSSTPPQKSRTSDAIPVFLGVLGTGFFLCMFLVFAAAGSGNSGTTSLFMNRVLPLSIVVYCIYAVLCLYLSVQKMKRAALIVSFGPLFLGFVVLPVVQILGMLITGNWK
jgi:hypothetical protein